MNYYGVFVTVELAREKGLIDKELEYDTIWEIGTGMYNDFLESKFNIGNKSEYDCINDFLNDRKNDTIGLGVLPIPNDDILNNIIFALDEYAQSIDSIYYGLKINDVTLLSMRNIIKSQLGM